jgi:hypothetical protein
MVVEEAIGLKALQGLFRFGRLKLFLGEFSAQVANGIRPLRKKIQGVLVSSVSHCFASTRNAKTQSVIGGGLWVHGYSVHS